LAATDKTCQIACIRNLQIVLFSILLVILSQFLIFIPVFAGMSQLYDFKMKFCSSLDATSAQNTFIAGSKLTELPSPSIYQVAGATFRQDANN